MRVCVLYLVLQLTVSNCCCAQAGMLDSIFGTNGFVFPPNEEYNIVSIVVQPDGKLLFSANHNFKVFRYNPDGTLDPTFGAGGVAETELGDCCDHGYKLALQPDGKVLVSGDCSVGADAIEYLGLCRFNADGSLDSGFGSNGAVVTAFYPQGQQSGVACAVQPDGKIVQAGRAHDASFPMFALLRFFSDGTLDSSFGNGGKVLTDIGNGYSGVLSLAVQPDGKILAGGISWSTSSVAPSCFVLARYNPDGSLDQSFGASGKVATYFGLGGNTTTTYDDDEAWDMLLQPDGKIVLVGTSTLAKPTGDGYTTGVALARYNADGSLDNTFGNGGKTRQEPPIPTKGFLGYGAALQPDGKIITTGSILTYPFGPRILMVARFDANGTLDPAFGNNGYVVLPVDTSNCAGWSAAVQADGKILAGGAGADGAFAARLLSGLDVGVLDLTAASPPVLIYPNPIGSEAVLRFTLAQDQAVTVSLFDAQGKLVQTFLTEEPRTAGRQSETLRFNGLPSGSYILDISNGTNHQGVKIIKQ